MAAVAIIGIFWYWGGSGTVTESRTAFEVKRGPLMISIIAGGTIEALESQTAKSSIRGETKILEIVEEGTFITEQDVANQKMLVRLDDSQLKERFTQAEIEYQSAFANFTDSREQYEIQIKQNESDIKAAELAARFARMDFEKYLGAQLAVNLLEELGLNVDLATYITREAAADAESKGDPAVAISGSPEDDAAAARQATEEESLDESQPMVLPGGGKNRYDISLTDEEGRNSIDFTKYASPDLLGDGEAQQRLRELQSSTLLAKQELDLAQTQLVGTRRLAEKNFVTQQELDNEELKVRKSEIGWNSASTSEELFIRYEFPKQSEQFLSDFEEALRSLERTLKQAIAKEAQAEARLRSSEANFKLRKSNRDELAEQLENCIIYAERSGLVVYAGSNDSYRQQAQIEEGAAIREGQEIITIPDMTQMAVNVKVHESSITKVKRGQKTNITFDARRGERLTGEVIKVSVLPDSNRRYMSPDIKEYAVSVRINGSHEWLQPGMSAQCEIIVNQLPDVIYVPLQAVAPRGLKRVAFVSDRAGNFEQREVETGEFNNEFIEVKSGLTEGEKVLLRVPDAVRREQAAEAEKEESTGAEAQGESEADSSKPTETGAATDQAVGAPGGEGGERRRRDGAEGEGGPAASAGPEGGDRPRGERGGFGEGEGRPRGERGGFGGGEGRPRGERGGPGGGEGRPRGEGSPAAPAAPAAS
ncbi:MAG: hypothetical protein AMXMBFR84_42150 [Candidatus Hydrogenedentota bacterium]